MRGPYSRMVSAVLVAAALAFGPAPLRAQGWAQIGFATTTSNVSVVTTTETVVIHSGPIVAPRDTFEVCVLGWAQFTIGADTTHVTPTIRRGNGATGTVVGEANAEEIKTAAADVEPFVKIACEQRTNVATVDYSFTLDQTGATGNGSALQAAILVWAR